MKSLCLVKFSALGDLAHLEPFLPSLAENYQVTLLTSPLGYEYFKDSSYIYSFIILPSKKLFDILKVIPQFCYQFDYFIDLQGNDRSKFLSFFSLSKRYGNYLSSYVCKDIPQYLKPHILEGSIYHLDTYSILSQVQSEFVIPSFQKKKPSYIVIHPGASQGWESKRLPDYKWVEFGQILNERYNLPYIIIGSKIDELYCEHIGKALQGNYVNLAGKTTLHELKEVLAEATLTLSTDSGPMHMSSVLATPTVGFFGATNWVRSAPFGEWSVVSIDKSYYSLGIPPQKSSKIIDNFYDGIKLSESLNELRTFVL